MNNTRAHWEKFSETFKQMFVQIAQVCFSALLCVFFLILE